MDVVSVNSIHAHAFPRLPGQEIEKDDGSLGREVQRILTVNTTDRKKEMVDRGCVWERMLFMKAFLSCC